MILEALLVAYDSSLLQASSAACHAVLQAILGIRVEWQNPELIPEERHVLVSNHVTTGDLIALYQRPKRIVHLISTALPKRVAQVLNRLVGVVMPV